MNKVQRSIGKMARWITVAAMAGCTASSDDSETDLSEELGWCARHHRCTVVDAGDAAAPSDAGIKSDGGGTDAGVQLDAGSLPPNPGGVAWWKLNAKAATVDPNSSTYISTWLSSYFPPPGYLITGSWGVAEADATSTSPCYKVPMTYGGTPDPTICIPLGTRPDPSGDGHLSIVDAIHGRETDFWQAKYDPTTQRISGASSASSFPLGFWTEQVAPCGWSGNAACFPLRRGLIEPSDIAKGVIDHALTFSTPHIGGTSTSYRYPATHNAPTCGTDCANHMVEGTWLRMSASVSCSSYGLPSWQVMICVALQNYGMFLRDNGGQVAIYGADRINQGGAADWAAVGFSGSSSPFGSGFPWSKLEVLSPPPH
jgi:hypothetical protein